MIVDLPENLEAALNLKANAHGTSPARYVCEILQRELASTIQSDQPRRPFKTGRGSFAKYGQAPSAEEIDANRADMFRSFSEDAG